MFFKQLINPLKAIAYTFEFEGIPSGDYETFCWDVTKEEYVRLCEREPRASEESNFNPGMYRIYPGLDIPDTIPSAKSILKVSIQKTYLGDSSFCTIVAKKK